jgi:putative hemolysin
MVVAAVGLVFSFVASAAEAAYLTVDPVTINARLKAGDKRAKLVLRLLEQKTKLVNTAVFLEVLGNVMAAVVIGNAVFGMSGSLGLAIGSILVVLVEIIFVVLVPMALGIDSCTKVALTLARTMVILDRAFSWLTVPLTHFSQSVAAKISKEAPHEIEEEFESYIELMVEKGELMHEAGIVMNNALKGSKLTARDIATPIKDVYSVKDTDTVAQTLKVMGQSKHQRLPVFSDGGHGVVGAVSFRALTQALADGELDAPVYKYAYGPPAVKTTDNLFHVLGAMNNAGVAVAFVYEGSELLGIISLTSLIGAILKIRADTT